MQEIPLSEILPQHALECLTNCSPWVLLDPAGPVAADEKRLILIAFALMLTVVIPVIVMAVMFAWKYRASNKSADFSPKWAHSLKIEVVVWLVPAVIVTVLSALVWDYSHRLDPYQPLASTVKPLHVEAVSMDWKWLFIYPELGIASVNQLVVPANVPVSFRITSDSVMTSFFIPQLGSQIYAMAGMETKLHLQASRIGVFQGLNSQFSGDGFSGMHFDAIATDTEGFNTWVRKVRQTNTLLDHAHFQSLEMPSHHTPVQYFAQITPGLFNDVLMKYMPDMSSNNKQSADLCRQRAGHQQFALAASQSIKLSHSQE